MEKRGALELSIGTIVIIVLAMTMLILGMVLVRSIMCGAVNLVKMTESGVKSEIDKLFQSTGGEVVCVGSGEKPVTLVPGEAATIYCSVDAPLTSEYVIQTKYPINAGVLKSKDVEDWIVGADRWKGNVAPGDELPKKVLRLQVPANAPHDLITFSVEVSRDGELISSQQLDFEVRKVGFFKSAIC